MNQYKTYPQYKDSGIEWLGEIPEHWISSYLKYIAKINMGQSPSSSTYNNDKIGTRFLQGNADFGKLYPMARTYTTDVKKLSLIGDILFTVRAPVGAMNISDKVYAIGRGLCAITATNKSHVPFLWFLMSIVKIELDTVATGSTYEAVSVEQVSNSVVSLPPLQEQQTIANYLDIATAKIDTLIAKQTKLIALLKEKRQAVISTAVTRGLDSTVPMKDSGVEWLGEIPEHWTTPKLKLFISTTKGFAFKSNDFIEDGVPVVKMSEIKNGTINRSSVFLPKRFKQSHKQVMLTYEDIVISTVGSSAEVKNSAVGQIGVVPKIHNESLLNQNTVIFSPNRKVLSNSYLPYILKSQIYREHLDLYAHGTANQASLNLEDMLKFVFSFPPLQEQQRIANYLDDKTSKIDTLITKATKAIELLKERLTALISAVVTGQIDVREV